MPHQLDTVIVPWFSRQEWQEVYYGAFSNNVESWKEARDSILVWQARVRKLPIGVDLTLPLLQSKIISADPMADPDVKSIMQGTALQRFVSNVVKLPQTQYYGHQTLHKLAAEVGLPGHLVDLRNEIIHGDSGYDGGCTVEAALETAFKWIRGYYWLPEYKQMNMETENMHQMPTINWKMSLRILDKYACSVLKGNLRSISLTKKSQLVVEKFQPLYTKDPQGCVKAVVEHLLLPLGQQCKLRLSRSEELNGCGCFLTLSVINAVNPILKGLLISNGSTQLILNSLIRKVVQENLEVASAWIILIISSLIKSPAIKGKNGNCQIHVLSLQKNGMNWRKMVCKLLAFEKEWALDLATRILDSPESNIPDEQVKKVKNLLDIANCKVQDNQSDRVINKPNTASEGELYSVESLVEYVDENKPDDCEALGKIQIASLPCQNGALTPLGILPHQLKNRQFYKDLILHYPDGLDYEPPQKKLKT